MFRMTKLMNETSTKVKVTPARFLLTILTRNVKAPAQKEQQDE